MSHGGVDLYPLGLPLSLEPFCRPVAAAVAAVRFQHGASFFRPRELSGHGKFDIVKSAINSKVRHGTQSKDTQPTRWLLSSGQSGSAWGEAWVKRQTRAKSSLRTLQKVSDVGR